jgi:hypothetical protein
VSKKKDPRTDDHEDPTAAIGGPLCPAPSHSRSDAARPSTRGVLMGNDEEYTVLDEPRTFADEQLDRAVIEDCGTVQPMPRTSTAGARCPSGWFGMGPVACRSRLVPTRLLDPTSTLGVGDREVLRRRDGDARSGRFRTRPTSDLTRTECLSRPKVRHGAVPSRSSRNYR